MLDHALRCVTVPTPYKNTPLHRRLLFARFYGELKIPQRFTTISGRRTSEGDPRCFANRNRRRPAGRSACDPLETSATLGKVLSSQILSVLISYERVPFSFSYSVHYSSISFHNSVTLRQSVISFLRHSVDVWMC